MSHINVDYEFYQQEYCGSMIPEAAFPRKSKDAEAFVNTITFGRIHSLELRPDDLYAVKMAICAVAETYHSADQRLDVKSENNDGYSVTYADASDRTIKARAVDAAGMYLADTTLRNRMLSYDY